ncbi:hypothetical protein CsSME_00000718 [Camellia sinensis var. sinensis]
METSKRRERVFRDFHYLLPVPNSLNTHHDGSVSEGRETEARDAD